MVEAMACGLPPIVVDYGGPAEIASDECGIRLPMTPRKELVNQLTEAMTTLLGDLERCRTMSAAGLEKVKNHFSWPQKAAQVTAIYHDLLGLPAEHSGLCSINTQENSVRHQESREVP